MKWANETKETNEKRQGPFYFNDGGKKDCNAGTSSKNRIDLTFGIISNYRIIELAGCVLCERNELPTLHGHCHGHVFHQWSRPLVKSRCTFYPTTFTNPIMNKRGTQQPAIFLIISPTKSFPLPFFNGIFNGNECKNPMICVLEFNLVTASNEMNKNYLL